MTRDGAQGSSTIKKMLTGSMLAFSLILLMLGLGTLVDGYVIGTYLGVDNMAAYGLVSPPSSRCSTPSARCSTSEPNRWWPSRWGSAMRSGLTNSSR